MLGDGHERLGWILSAVPSAWNRVVEDMRGWRGLPVVYTTLYLLSLDWRSLGFPALPLLAPGSSHRLGDMIVFLAAVT